MILICSLDISPTNYKTKFVTWDNYPYIQERQKHPDNYRDITLLNTSMKLFTGILKERLETQISNREEQQDFIIKQLKEKSIEFNTPAYVCFIVITKAFDRIFFSDIVNIVIAKETPDTHVKAVRSLNMNNMTKVKAGNLFNLLMDRIIEEISSLNMGYRMEQNKRISMVCYADDAAIFAETENDLQKQLHKFYQVSQAMNMIISIKKTKSSTFAKDLVRCKLVVHRASLTIQISGSGSVELSRPSEEPKKPDQ